MFVDRRSEGHGGSGKEISSEIWAGVGQRAFLMSEERFQVGITSNHVGKCP